jgi:quinohemoprotein ethanol dehydrogenase
MTGLSKGSESVLRRLALLCGIALICPVGCDRGEPHTSSSAKEPAAVDAARMLAADDEPGNWMSHGRTYSEQRFSPLRQINDQNVKDLGLAWYFEVGTKRGLEVTPLVVDGVMYASSIWNIIHAIDARTGEELWRYDPQTRRDRLRHTCCDATNRGLAVWNGKIYQGLIDGRLIAVDAATGKLVWDVQTVDLSKDYSITGAPRVVNGKVIIGNSGAEFGVRGYVTAYDAETGAQAWRFYTVPGNPADGFESPAMEMAAKTWSGEWWKYGGGGTAWDSFAFDPDLNLLYIGVGNGGPWPREIRSPGGGDNLFLASIVAVNAATGEYVWHYQTTPGDQWDFTATQSMSLADLEINGKVRKVIIQAPKNGFFYVLDRGTGELISAHNIVPTTWASHVDLNSGRPVIVEENQYGDKARLITPGPSGAHNWHPMSFSPITGLAYIPLQETSWVYSQAPVFKYIRGQWNMGHNPDAERPPEAANIVSKGALLAWDPVKEQPAWRVELGPNWNGGTLATAGNLVVQGSADGRFVIYRADSGEKVWEMPIQTGAVAGPITYSVDDEQYIAVAAGWGGASALWGGNRERARNELTDSRILAFKLGGTGRLPPAPARKQISKPPPSTATAEVIAAGKRLYDTSCNVCHGVNVIGGTMPDLRHMSAETHGQFNDIVLGGIRLSGGMASFADKYDEADVEAIHAYVISRANQDWEADMKN